ncbi:putative glucose-6-phosphate 1-epimerase [Quercus suber]|uniref:Glucose-6-phosphate 1-epimerase n=1 Tax=Quercus suber TaxID=58331 RepID=A0AAW0LDR0_QUESU
MSNEKVLSSASASASASAPLASTHAELCKGINGLDKVVLRDPRGSSAEVYLYGAHVTSWKNDHGEELLFVSSKWKL